MDQIHVDERYYKLLCELQEIDFVLVELTLYLDTHPNDANALQQYNTFAQKRKPVVNEIEKFYGPMMQFGHSYSRFPWQWALPPWPWQV